MHYQIRDTFANNIRILCKCAASSQINHHLPSRFAIEANVDLMQVSWNYLNDCLRTPMSVEYTPGTISCSCICIAANLLQIPLPLNSHWAQFLNVSLEQIENVVISLMRVYHKRKHIKIFMETSIVDKLNRANMKKMAPKNITVTVS